MSLSGGLNILKPPGMTSHDVVSFVRRTIREKRVGHAGTLDPAAAGVLPVCIGEATKVVQFLQDGTKEYRAELVLGIETDSQDYTGVVLREAGSGPLCAKERLAEVLGSFVGQGFQIPPMVSAVKVDGRRCYDLAREGVVVEREARAVTFESIRLVTCPDSPSKGDRVVLHVACGKGTYIRTLCHDIGSLLGCGAHMGFLLRTRVGSMHIGGAISLEELAACDSDSLAGLLVSPDELLSAIPALDVEGAVAVQARNGAALAAGHIGDPISVGCLYRVRHAGHLLAVYECISRGGELALKVVRGFVC